VRVMDVELLFFVENVDEYIFVKLHSITRNDQNSFSKKLLN